MKANQMVIKPLKNVGRPIIRKIMANSAIRQMLHKICDIGMLPDCIWKRLPVETTFEVSLNDEGSFQYSPVAYDIIGRCLYWQSLRAFEPETTRIFISMAKKAKRFLDIGANTGLYSLLACAANPDIKGIAFEPLPFNYELLCRNIRLNGWQDRCLLENVAVSNFIGSAPFHVPHTDVPGSVLFAASLNPMGLRGMDGDLIEVSVTTIDAVCSEHRGADLIKIDVEGFEDKVLEGMHDILSASQAAIIAECNPDGPYQAVQKTLSRFGYCFFHLREEGPVPMEEIIPDKMGRYKNYLCLPEQRLDWLSK